MVDLKGQSPSFPLHDPTTLLQTPQAVELGSQLEPNRTHMGSSHCSKIEVFTALQTRFGPSKHTSLKTNPSKRNPKLKVEDVT